MLESPGCIYLETHSLHPNIILEYLYIAFPFEIKLIKHVSIKQICKFPSPFPHQITTNNQVSPFIRNCTFNIHVPRPAKQLIRPLQKTVGTQKPLFPAHKWATTSCYYPHKLLGNHLCPGPLFRSSPATLVFIKLIMCQPLCWVPSMVGSCVCWAVLR